MTSPEIRFRPFMEVTGIYDTGLAGVTVKNAAGDLANVASLGAGLTWGISGTKSWRHTKVGLDYRGSLDHYAQQTSFDNTSQEVLFGFSQALSRHVIFTMRSTAGTFSRDFGLQGLTQTVPFDPGSTYIPRTDFFDNRTSYVTAQGDLTFQKSARLSFNIGGDGSIVRRRSAALYGVVSGGARGDVHYRLTRRSTIGVAYFYQHYDFTRIFGGTDLHSVVGAYGLRISRSLEFSGYGGVLRNESKFIQSTSIDPVIALLLGITSSPQIFHTIALQPNWSARLSRTFSTGVAYGGGGHSVVPGNGLFLTSAQSTAFLGYGYTGLRRWSINGEVRYSDSSAAANVSGKYGDLSTGFSASRRLRSSLHIVGRYQVRRYSSADFKNYNRVINEVRLGIGFTPGEVPLRIW